MTTFWKYELTKAALEHDVTVEVPDGSYPVHAAFQGRTLCVWFHVPDTDASEIRCTMRVFGTGWQVPDEKSDERIVMYQHVATVHDGPLVWHVCVRHEYPAIAKPVEVSE